MEFSENMNNNTRKKFKARTKSERQDIAAAGELRKYRNPKVGRSGAEIMKRLYPHGRD